MPKLVKNNGDPLLSNKSLMKNDSTRLRFSIWVIIANFIMGTVGMILGSDLTALGVFISLCNTPLYAYILGRTFRGADIPDSYYEQSHSGSGGLAGVLKTHSETSIDSTTTTTTTKPDEYNMPTGDITSTDETEPIKVVKKDEEEVG